MLTRPESPYPQCRSRPRKALTLGEVFRSSHCAGQSHEGLAGVAGFGLFELVADNLALGHAGLRRDPVEPLGKFLAKTHCNCITHMAKLYPLDFEGASVVDAARILRAFASVTRTARIFMGIVAAALFALPAAAPLAQPVSPTARTSQLDQQWLDTVVSIERLSGEGREIPLGTGFIVISPRGRLLLVTAKHIVQDAEGRLLKDLAYRLNRPGGSSLLVKDADFVQAGGGSWFVSPQDDIAVRFLPIASGASVKAIPMDRFVEEQQVRQALRWPRSGFRWGCAPSTMPCRSHAAA